MESQYKIRIKDGKTEVEIAGDRKFVERSFEQIKELLDKQLRGRPTKIEKKRGRKTDMLKEVLETIGGSGIKELRIPIKVNIPEDEDNASKENFSLENIYNFLDIPDMYRTGKCDIEDTGFTMVMKRIEVEEKEKPKLMQVAKDKIKEKISKMKEYFS